MRINPVFILLATLFLAGPAMAEDLDEGSAGAVDWVCRYSAVDASGPLHLVCLTASRDPVAIPIWAYDYGDGMVEQLMRSALCYRSVEPCTVFLNRQAAAVS